MRTKVNTLPRNFATCLGMCAALSAATGLAGDLDVTRTENAAGPQVRIEVQMSWDNSERTIIVPRDLTIVDRELPGTDEERTGGGLPEYYGLSGCDWSGLRTKLQQTFEQSSREDLIFRMRNYINAPANEMGPAGRLMWAFYPAQALAGNSTQFIPIGGHAGIELAAAEKQSLRNGQQVSMNAYAAGCIVHASVVLQVLESALQAYERYTGVSRNTPN